MADLTQVNSETTSTQTSSSKPTPDHRYLPRHLMWALATLSGCLNGAAFVFYGPLSFVANLPLLFALRSARLRSTAESEPEKRPICYCCPPLNETTADQTPVSNHAMQSVEVLG